MWYAGAVLYPITMADFTIADVTDGMMDGGCAFSVSLAGCVRFLSRVYISGYIAGFPNTYAEKVGKTSDASYKGPSSFRAWRVAFHMCWYVSFQPALRKHKRNMTSLPA